MAENNGWIKLHRKLLNSAVFDNANLLKTWLWCLCKASHKNYEAMIGNQIIQLQEGQFVFGRKAAAVELGFTESMVYRHMALLEKLQMLNTKSNNKFSVVTIEKWAFYQGETAEPEQQPEQQMNNKRTTNEQQVNTNKNVKNDKNVKNEKKIYSEIPELQETIEAFIEFREKIKKPMTNHAVDLLLKKLNQMTDSENEKIAILNQSIMNGWLGVFPIKDGDKNGTNSRDNSASEQHGTYL